MEKVRKNTNERGKHQYKERKEIKSDCFCRKLNRRDEMRVQVCFSIKEIVRERGRDRVMPEYIHTARKTDVQRDYSEKKEN